MSSTASRRKNDDSKLAGILGSIWGLVVGSLFAVGVAWPVVQEVVKKDDYVYFYLPTAIALVALITWIIQAIILSIRLRRSRS